MQFKSSVNPGALRRIRELVRDSFSHAIPLLVHFFFSSPRRLECPREAFAGNSCERNRPDYLQRP